MSIPVFEKEQYSFPAFEPNNSSTPQQRPESDEDGTLQGEIPEEDPQQHQQQHGDHLYLTTSYAEGPDHIEKAGRSASFLSATAQREQSRRLEDDLEMLCAERNVSNVDSQGDGASGLGRSRSMGRSRSRTHLEPVDEFDIGTNPIHEKVKSYAPPVNSTTKLAKLFKRVHSSSFLVRYFFYIAPLFILLLIPVLLGRLLFKNSSVGGVDLFWFGIWLEIVWLTLWASRVIYLP
jgi:hypothetical protein